MTTHLLYGTPRAHAHDDDPVAKVKVAAEEEGAQVGDEGAEELVATVAPAATLRTLIH